MSNLTCPYCYYQLDSPDEMGESNPHEWECRGCGKTFMFEVDYNPTYREWKAPCLNGEGPHDMWDVRYEGALMYKICSCCGSREYMK